MKMIRYCICIIFIAFSYSIQLKAQVLTDALFDVSDDTINNEELLAIRLQLQISTLKKETNDSTYMPSTLFYKADSEWDSVPVKIRTRGHFRLKNCVFPPVKLKFSKADSSETIFSGNKKLKLVVPCENVGEKNDYVVKEYMAYKLLEPVTPYHFKTRLVNLEWIQKTNRKKGGFKLKGILLEDIDHLVNRFEGKEYDKTIHPLRIDTLNAMRNAFFQYMIGNDDYSVVLGHNRKAMYLENNFIIIPYDFDLSGLVGAEYGKSSDVVDNRYKVNESIARVYRDYPRDRNLLEKVRQEFLEKKPEIVQNMEHLEKYFENKDDYVNSELYVMKFFKILEDDKKFEKHFVKWAKTD